MSKIDFCSPRWMYQERQQHLTHIERRILSTAYVAYVLDRADALPDGKFDFELAQQLEDMLWDVESYSEGDFRQSTYSYAFEDYEPSNVVTALHSLNDFDRRQIAGIAQNIVASYDHMKRIEKG